jgi:hypothetical protein
MLVKKQELESIREQYSELSGATNRDATREFAYRAASRDLNDALKVSETELIVKRSRVF